MKNDLSYQLKDLENELKNAAHSFENIQIDLVTLSNKTKILMNEIVQNPNILTLEDKIYFENCLKHLHILEEKLNNQMNQFVMTMSYIK